MQSDSISEHASHEEACNADTPAHTDHLTFSHTLSPFPTPKTTLCLYPINNSRTPNSREVDLRLALLSPPLAAL